MISTTKEQSARLLQCGVPAESADMARYEDDSVPMMPWDWTTGSYGGTFPAWSPSALLGLLFKSGHILSMQYEHNEYRLQSFYSSGDFVTYGITAIEACVNMVEKLVANGYKLDEQ